MLCSLVLDADAAVALCWRLHTSYKVLHHLWDAWQLPINLQHWHHLVKDDHGQEWVSRSNGSGLEAFSNDMRVPLGMISRAATKGMSDTIKILISLIQRNVRYLGQPGTTGKVAAITQDQRQEVTGTYPEEAIWRMRAGWIFALFITVAVLCILPFLRRSHHELSTIMRDNDGSNNTSTQIVWRGVFIRDLEQELNGGGQWLNKANSR